jgi:hypothetical protein
MYKCEVFGTMSKPGEKCNKIVVEKRAKVYTRKYRDELTGRIEEVEVGRGWEIVKEINASDEGVRFWNETQQLASK